MQTVRFRRVLWVLIALAAWLGAAPSLAQQTGQVTNLTIVSPPPATFNSANPFRTNRQILRIEYSHDGNSGNYFVTTNGADSEGTGFLPQPSDNSGDLFCDVGNAGANNPKTINLTLLQTRINVVAETNVPVVVVFDATPPTLNLISLRIGGNNGVGGTVLGLTPPTAQPGNGPLTGTRVFTVAGTTGVFRTRADNLSISANANDTFTPLAQVQATREVPEAGIAEEPVDAVANQPGTFNAEFDLSNRSDGTYTLTVRANDQVNDPFTTATLSKGNVSIPHVVQIIRDTTAPRVTNIEILRNVGAQGGQDLCGKPVSPLTTGLNTFVGNEPVGVRITFNEDISIPRVTVQQTNGNAQPLQPINPPANRTSVYTFQFSPFAVDAQNGPAILRISGRNVGTNSPQDPGEGTDEAGNGVTPDQQSALTLNGAFVVDTFGPDLRRELSLRQQTTPFDGQVVSNDQLFFTATGTQLVRGSFPRVLSAQIIDLPPAGGTLTPDTASGVDFTQVLASGAATTVTSSGRLNISLTGPRGPIPVPPQIPVITGTPPTLLQLQLVSASDGSLNELAGNPNFEQQSNGVVRAVEGTYTMTINMIDKVCNTRSRTVRFTVDNTPIRETELQVLIGGRLIQQRGFCFPFDGTPTRPLPAIEVRSTASDFSTTSTRFTVLGKFNGNDSPEYPTVLTTFVVNQAQRSISAQIVGIEKADPTGVNFPIPTTAATDVIPPGVFDPRVGRFDGPYTIRLFPSDAAGNVGVITTSGRLQTALDYDVNLDTLMPVTERTFPKDGSFINAPLRFVDATILDPPALRIPRLEVQGDFGNPTNVSKFATVPGCGIDVNRTVLAARLETPYQPGRVQANNLIEGGGTSGKIRGTLRFIHTPNDFDPTLPGFQVGDNRFKVLLEFAVPPGQTQVGTLPTNGSMDGTYSIVSVPRDRAGLSVSPATNGNAAPPRQGTYFGVTNSTLTTQSIVAFTWLYDTVAPLLHVDNFPGVIEVGSTIQHQGPLVLSQQSASTLSGAVSSQHKVVSSNNLSGTAFIGRQFRITGFARDLSARGGDTTPGDPFQGGSGMDHVEYELKLVDANRQLVNPTTTNNLNGVQCAAAAIDADGNVRLGCVNPIISLKRGAMTTFPQEVNPTASASPFDPVPTLADPIEFKPAAPAGSTNYATTVRPRHAWVIEDVLPENARIPAPRASPVGDHYVFTIRAIDRAGNVTEIQKDVAIGDVKAPAITAPTEGQCIASTAVQVKWAPVSGVTTYVVTLDRPEPLADVPVTLTFPNPTTANPPSTTFNGLSAQGQYGVFIQSVDAVGNRSAPSATRSFRIDTQEPRIESIEFGSGVIPVSRTGVLHLGKVHFNVAFSEGMRKAPALFFDPAGDSVGPQATTTLGFTPGNLQVTYEGEIPTNARAANWDGLATLTVRGGEDQCGLKLLRQPTQQVEIDTGPDFESRFFFNPMAPQEIVLTLVTSEELIDPPRMTELTNLSQIGTNNEGRRFVNNGKAFFSTFTLQTPDVANEVGLQVSLTDLKGNTSQRPLTFTVTPLTSTSTASALSVDRKLTVNVPAGAVVGQLPLYVLPASDPTRHQVASSVSKLFATPGTAKSAQVLAGQDAKAPTEQGLKILRYLNELAPGGVVLQKPAQVIAAPGGIRLPEGALPGQLGLYVWNGAKWTWAGASHDGQTVTGSVRNFGPLAMALDQGVPAVTNLSIADGDRLDSSQQELTATLTDSGSGISADGVSVLIDDQAVPFTFKEETGEIRFTPAKPLVQGAHTLALSVKDRAGNAAQTQKLKMLAPAPFGFSELISYPNPARVQARIRTRITQPGVTQRVEVSIYDVASQKVTKLAQDGPFTNTAVDIPWDLVNDRGRGVANGVYLYEVKVLGISGQKVKGRGKLAVQR